MPLNRRLPAVLALVAALCALAVSAPAGAQVDSQALGAALVHIDGTKLSFSVAIANPARETFVAGHVHAGAGGVNGPVLVTLFAGSNDRKLFFHAARIDITAEQAAQICGDLGGHYVNYHTTQDPQGAVRGQLAPV